MVISLFSLCWSVFLWMIRDGSVTDRMCNYSVRFAAEYGSIRPFGFVAERWSGEMIEWNEEAIGMSAWFKIVA